jgi:hypothetical protein
VDDLLYLTVDGIAELVENPLSGHARGRNACFIIKPRNDNWHLLQVAYDQTPH